MKYKTILSLIFFTVSTSVFAQYNGGSSSGYGASSSNVVSVSAFLQGPFSGGAMTTTLSTNPAFPLAQPYSGAPWNYTGTESVSSIPTGVVDWVLIELRTGTAASTVTSRRACFIKSDGSIVDLDGTNPVKFDKTDGNSYYVVIRHRNHLAVMSAISLTLSSSLAGVYLIGNSTEYDFSTAQSQAFGTSAMRDLGSGFFGMFAGDANGNGQIQNNDSESYWAVQNGQSGYREGDFNLNGQVQNNDRETYWLPNNGKGTQVP